MKKLAMYILCLLLLTVLCLPAFAEEVDQRTLADIMTEQVSDEVLAALKNTELYQENYYEELIRIDFDNCWILTEYCNVFTEKNGLPLETVVSEAYLYASCYVIDKDTYVTKKIQFYWNQEQITKIVRCSNCELPPYLQSVFSCKGTQLELCGTMRDVINVYVFYETGHAWGWAAGVVYYVTTDGTFVKFYPTKDGPAVDMPLQEYQAWVDAFLDYKDFYNDNSYAEIRYKWFGINAEPTTLGTFYQYYQTTDAYYADITAIRQQWRTEYITKVLIIAAVAAVLLGGTAWILHRRSKKKSQ